MVAKKQFREFPFHKGEIVEVAINALGEQGIGIGHYEGAAVFVPNTLPGERVQARITFLAARYAKAELLEILSASQDRRQALCPVYKKCGGCQIQHLTYAGQLKVKQAQVSDCLKRIGKMDDLQVPIPLGMEQPWHYRNKGAFPAGVYGSKTTLGLYAVGSHDLIPVSGCPIQQEPCDKVLETVQSWMRSHNISVYDEVSGSGLLRHVLIRTNRKGEFMVTMVINGEHLPESYALIEALVAINGFTGLALNVNRIGTNVIMGKETRILYGVPALEEELDGLKFSLSPASFFQINTIQTEKLYRVVMEFADLRGCESVFDAYCGIGSISLFLARKAKKVLGVEVIPAAIEDARRNAIRNGITNASFVCGKAEEELPRLLAEGHIPDLVVVDPPRKGCDEKMLHAIAESQVPRLIYVSCNPATLARDVNILARTGYKVKRIQPVDLFPQTMHVETVALLSRRKDEPRIQVMMNPQASRWQG